MTEHEPDPARIAAYRSSLYALLARVFRAEPDADLIQTVRRPDFVEALGSMGVAFDETTLAAPVDEMIETLTVEYTRLFIGPGGHVAPMESIHHELPEGKWGALWGDSTVEVKKFVESVGLEFRGEFESLPDHVSVELELMAALCARESELLGEGETGTALVCLEAEKTFLRDHAAKWIPGFCEKVIRQAHLSFYRELAKVTKSFVEFEAAHVEGYLAAAQGEPGN